jgi:hypothetical protein
MGAALAPILLLISYDRPAPSLTVGLPPVYLTTVMSREVVL